MRIAVLAAFLSLLIASTAGAAPIVIGAGNTPSVAVDAAGVAYIVWNADDTANTPQFCRLARGAASCTVISLTVPVGTSSVTRPVVQVSGLRVTVLGYRTGQSQAVFRWTSTDGGQNFGAPTSTGVNVPIYDYAIGPGDTASLVTDAEPRGGLFSNVPFASGVATGIATLSSDPYYSAVGLMNNGQPLVIYEDGSSVGAFRRYLGTGDPNVGANWSTPPVSIGTAYYPRLAGGSLGLFMLAGDGSGGLFARKFDGTNFGAATTLATGVQVPQAGLFEDPAGELHAVYPVLDATGYHAMHAVSDDGVTWRATELDVRASELQETMRVATAADHVGVAVWALDDQITVAAVGPPAVTTQPPPVVTPTPTPTPTATPTPAVQSVAGTILVRVKGSKKFVSLKSLADIPKGATIDSTHGTVEITVPNGSVQLRKGWFTIAQSKGLTTFTLNQPLAACRGAHSAVAAKKPKTRQLWGSGKGAFKTAGKYSAATVRGTAWKVKDSCAGTLTTVTTGVVDVRDNVRKRTVVLRKGKHYLARPRS